MDKEDHIAETSKEPSNKYDNNERGSEDEFEFDDIESNKSNVGVQTHVALGQLLFSISLCSLSRDNSVIDASVINKNKDFDFVWLDIVNCNKEIHGAKSGPFSSQNEIEIHGVDQKEEPHDNIGSLTNRLSKELLVHKLISEKSDSTAYSDVHFTSLTNSSKIKSLVVEDQTEKQSENQTVSTRKNNNYNISEETNIISLKETHFLTMPHHLDEERSLLSDLLTVMPVISVKKSYSDGTVKKSVLDINDLTNKVSKKEDRLKEQNEDQKVPVQKINNKEFVRTMASSTAPENNLKSSEEKQTSNNLLQHLKEISVSVEDTNTENFVRDNIHDETDSQMLTITANPSENNLNSLEIVVQKSSVEDNYNVNVVKESRDTVPSQDNYEYLTNNNKDTQNSSDVVVHVSLNNREDIDQTQTSMIENAEKIYFEDYDDEDKCTNDILTITNDSSSTQEIKITFTNTEEIQENNMQGFPELEKNEENKLNISINEDHVKNKLIKVSAEVNADDNDTNSSGKISLTNEGLLEDIDKTDNNILSEDIEEDRHKDHSVTIMTGVSVVKKYSDGSMEVTFKETKNCYQQKDKNEFSVDKNYKNGLSNENTHEENLLTVITQEHFRSGSLEITLASPESTDKEKNGKIVNILKDTKDDDEEICLNRLLSTVTDVITKKSSSDSSIKIPSSNKSNHGKESNKTEMSSHKSLTLCTIETLKTIPEISITVDSNEMKLCVSNGDSVEEKVFVSDISSKKSSVKFQISSTVKDFTLKEILKTRISEEDINEKNYVLDIPYTFAVKSLKEGAELATLERPSMKLDISSEFSTEEEICKQSLNDNVSYYKTSECNRYEKKSGDARQVVNINMITADKSTNTLSVNIEKDRSITTLNAGSPTELDKYEVARQCYQREVKPLQEALKQLQESIKSLECFDEEQTSIPHDKFARSYDHRLHFNKFRSPTIRLNESTSSIRRAIHNNIFTLYNMQANQNNNEYKERPLLRMDKIPETKLEEIKEDLTSIQNRSKIMAIVNPSEENLPKRITHSRFQESQNSLLSTFSDGRRESFELYSHMEYKGIKTISELFQISQKDLSAAQIEKPFSDTDESKSEIDSVTYVKPFVNLSQGQFGSDEYTYTDGSTDCVPKTLFQAKRNNFSTVFNNSSSRNFYTNSEEKVVSNHQQQQHSNSILNKPEIDDSLTQNSMIISNVKKTITDQEYNITTASQDLIDFISTSRRLNASKTPERIECIHKSKTTMNKKCDADQM